MVTKKFLIDLLNEIKNDLTKARNGTKDGNTQKELNDAITKITNILYK